MLSALGFLGLSEKLLQDKKPSASLRAVTQGFPCRCERQACRLTYYIEGFLQSFLSKLCAVTCCSFQALIIVTSPVRLQQVHRKEQLQVQLQGFFLPFCTEMKPKGTLIGHGIKTPLFSGNHSSCKESMPWASTDHLRYKRMPCP